jgi:hypothetical protein
MIEVGAWVWVSALRLDPDNWARKVETLARIVAIGEHPSEPGTARFRLEYFLRGERHNGWFGGFEFWPCHPDEEEIAEWLSRIIAS